MSVTERIRQRIAEKLGITGTSPLNEIVAKLEEVYNEYYEIADKVSYESRSVLKETLDDIAKLVYKFITLYMTAIKPLTVEYPKLIQKYEELKGAYGKAKTLLNKVLGLDEAQLFIHDVKGEAEIIEVEEEEAKAEEYETPLELLREIEEEEKRGKEILEKLEREVEKELEEEEKIYRELLKELGLE